MIDRSVSEVESIWQDFQLNLSVCLGCSSTSGRRQILPLSVALLGPVSFFPLYLPPAKVLTAFLFSLALSLFPFIVGKQVRTG